MKALDTSVLIRFLMRDDDRQSGLVYRMFKKAEADRDVFFIPLTVLLETLWVLESVYKISRVEILEAMDALASMPILEFEAQDAVGRFISSAGKNESDLSDLLIAHSAGFAGCDCVLTFDKRASEFELFELVE